MATPNAAAAAGTATPRPGPLPSTRPQPGNLPKLEDGYGPTPQQQAAMTAAAKQARASGKPVAVDGLTTETQQVLAQPKGGFALADNPKPVRTNQHGKWVAVDTTLHRNADGTLSPTATAYGSVALSGGGKAPLATTTSGATTYAVSWPGALPAPMVSGSTATYAEVFPGVDLVVSATDAGGFSEVLVVKNHDAAGNPALRSLRLATTTTGGKAAAGPHGGVTVGGAKGGNALTASTPLMWDSSTKIQAPTGKNAPNTPAGGRIGPDPSDVNHPGLAAHVAEVATKTTATELTLSADQHLLTAADTVFPLYIDPTFNWHPTTGGTPAFDEVKQGAPCTNSSFYNRTDSTGDFGQLGVGVNGWDSCFGTMRAYYQWQLPSVIWGADIGNAGQPGAAVNATKIYSANCTTTATVNLHWSGGIGAGTSWNSQPGYGGSIAQADFGPAINPTFCPKNGTVTHGFDVTNAIAQSAAAHSTQFTVALTEDAYESSRSDAGFGRFTDNPTLQIFFNRAPNTPGANQLDARSGADDVGCATSGQYPYLGKAIATNTPVLSATVTDPDGDHLQADFQYWVDGGGPTDGSSADGISSGGTAALSLPSSFISGLSNGQVVSWKARVTDGQDWSDWSPTCHFIAEPTAPSAPSIISTEGRYPNDGTVGAVSGTPGRFTVSSTGGTVSKMVDGFDEEPPQNNPPAADVMTPNGSADIAAAGRWKLADGSGTTVADSVGHAPATLSGATAWTTDSVHGKVLTLTGNGFAATNGPVIKTDGSFTISAWVNASSATDSGAVLGQDSVFASGFYLENVDGKWSFSKLASDDLNAGAIRAESTNPPQPGVWTHLAGVYDAATGKMTIYLNGQAQGTATDSTPYAANGPFTIGRAQWNAQLSGDFKGSVSDVQAYQAALSPTDIAKIYAGTTIAPAGRWRTTEGTGTTLGDGSGGNHPITLHGSTGWTAPTDDTPAVNFSNGNGNSYGTATGPVLDTQQSFTVSAWAKLSDLTNYSAVVSQQATHTSGFQLRYSPDVKAWIFGMPTVDGTGDNYQWAYVDNSVTQTGQWTHVTGVYDAAAKQISLYVNGQLTAQKAVTTVIPAAGPFLIGGTYYSDTLTASFHGALSDVQAYQTALSASEIAEMAASATRSYTPKYPGPHTLTAYMADPAGDTSGTQTYRFLAGQDPSTTCASLAACFNNVSISPDNNMKLGNADGGDSFSAGGLTTAGWASGGTVGVNGATFTLPQFGSGQADNVLAANQTVTFAKSVPPTGSSALEFLATATTAATAEPGSINGDITMPYVPAGTPVAGSYCFNSAKPNDFCAPQGTINYTDGSSQPYFLTVPDWVLGPETLAAVTLSGRNQQSGSADSQKAKIYPFSVPLAAGKTIASVTLPDVGTSPAATQALHIYGMATRDTTVDGAAAGKTWTGAWSAPTEGIFNYGSTMSNLTFREAVRPSIGGDTVRIKFDNALGVTPLNIKHATIALASGGDNPTAVPAGTPQNLTFGTSVPVTLPEGGMAYSDPVHLTVPAGKYVLVSFEVDNSVPFIPTHTDSNNTSNGYATANGKGDQTTDTTGTPFVSTGSATNVVTDLDVQTSGVPTQAVVGDGYIDQAQTGKVPPSSSNLSSVLNEAEPTTPSPYGSIEAGIESNQVMRDYPEANGSGPALLSRIDRDVLDQPGLSTVVLNEGLEDVLAGRSATDLTSNGLTTLINYLAANGIAVVAAGLTPCDGYAGDGATPNDACTPDVDKQRVAVNQWLSGSPDNLGPWTTPPLFYLDSDAALGVPDSTTNEVKLSNVADSGDHVNITYDGFGRLAASYLGAQDTWRLDDGTTTSDATIAADSANSTANQYLINNPAAGNNQANLTGSASWANDSTRGTVLSLDGFTGYAATAGPALNTAGSFSVSAWVNPAVLSAGNASVLAEDGQHSSAFMLAYNAATKGWSFTVSPTDTPTPANPPAVVSSLPANLHTWTHLVGVYNATTRTAQLYVNGDLNGQIGNVTSYAASGPLTIGRHRWNDAAAGFFPGSISDAQAWNYALTPTEVAGMSHQG